MTIKDDLAAIGGTLDAALAAVAAKESADVAGLQASVTALQAAVAALQPPVPVPDPIPAPPAPGTLSVTIAIAGVIHAFAAADAVDQGDLVSPIGGFTQRCLRLTDKAIPLTVFFRPDKDGKRDEVVIEWGDVWAGTSSTLPPSQLVISKGAATLATLDIPAMPWLTRYRWSSAPRPLARTGKDLIAARLVAPYDAAVANVPLTTPAQAASWAYKILGLSSITPYMPQTGERNDIGLTPEATAEYLATGNPSALAVMMAWAEASGSIPWHIRDGKTGAPLSWDTYPQASTYGDQSKSGPPRLALASAASVTIDAAHAPELAYVAYQLTGDPYYLEELQLAVDYLYADTLLAFRPSGIRADQTREFAWTLRGLFLAAKATPETVPAWLQPRSCWQAKLTKALGWLTQNFVTNPDPRTAQFRFGVTLGNTLSVAPWQEDYLAAVLGLGVWLGFAEWLPALTWKIGADIARTNGTSGWPRTRPTYYYLTLTHADGTLAKDWADLAAINGVVETADGQIDPAADANYMLYLRGALALAVRNGITEALPCFQWVDAYTAKSVKAITRRWAIAAA